MAFADFKWADRRTWPQDTTAYIFLANAVLDAGKALVPGWSGDEPWHEVSIPRPLPSSQGRFVPDLDYEEAHMLLSRAGHSDLPKLERVTEAVTPELAAEIERYVRMTPLEQRRHRQLGKPIPGVRRFYPPNLFTEDQWASATRLREEERRQLTTENDARMERLHVAMRLIHSAVIEGRLRVGLRAELGGSIAPLEDAAAIWNTEKDIYEHWFLRCAFSQRDPHRPRTYPDAWLFLDRANLTAMSSAQNRPRAIADRTPKKTVSADVLSKWVNEYFGQFTRPNAPRQKEAEAAFLLRFPGHSTTQFREQAWPRRPEWMLRSYREKS